MGIRTLVFTSIAMAFALFFGFVFQAHAADLNFEWTPNTEAITGYKIHYGTESGNYTEVVDVGLPATTDGKVRGTVLGIPENVPYYFSATAYNHDQESPYSDEVAYTATWSVPVKVGGFMITISVKPTE